MKKPQIILSYALTFIIGLVTGFAFFAADGSPPEKFESLGETSPQIRTTPDDLPPVTRPIPDTSNSNPQPSPPQLSGDAQPPESLQKAERAKWLRLIEVLGLDSDQAKALEAAIAESRPRPDEDTPLDAAYSKAGENLEKNILAMLNPEQQAAFREMQRRSLGNRVEVKAQKEFAESLTSLDLTAEQREQALEVLRKQAEKNAAAIPSSTRLLLGGSFLPIGDEKATDDSFELMGQLQPKPGEPLPTYEQIATLHRAELERRMTQFEGILSPGQLALYQASISQALENLDIIAPQR